MKANYHPDIDISDELGDDVATQFQQIIGILQLQWSVELGHINIITEVSFLLSFNVLLRRRHLKAAYLVFEHISS